jgi:hypothetical protein
MGKGVAGHLCPVCNIGKIYARVGKLICRNRDCRYTIPNPPEFAHCRLPATAAGTLRIPPDSQLDRIDAAAGLLAEVSARLQD